MITRIRSIAAAGAMGLALGWLGPVGVAAGGDDVRSLEPASARSLPVAMASNPCNPCANVCNPCAKRNACNPCAQRNPCNPCGAGANPCNPCGGASVDPARFVKPKGQSLAGGSRAELVARGEKLWSDGSLSSNGAACSTCHIQGYAQMQPTFAEPYPHRVTMVEQLSGVAEVSAAEMVQFCMLQPMQAEPLPWSSQDLASLAAYVEHIQPGYRPVAGGAANPCNPCGLHNACNPCNPCAKHNPCNPCGGH